jgi:RNA polymerase sigma-70 factor (ECF subfamily)
VFASTAATWYLRPVESEDGARSRFEDFARHERSALLGIARRLCSGGSIDPEDLVQEALERAFRQRQRLDGQPDAARRAFTRTAMTNHFLDLCRKRQTERAAADPGPAVEAAASPERAEPEQWMVVSDEQFLAAIRRLRPDKLQQAYQLHARGMRYREIARQLGAPEGTVGAWLTGARDQLRQLLSEVLS